MSWEILEKVAKVITDPVGCEELEKKPSGQGSGRESLDALDLHYPTRGVGDAYDSSHSFWDRRKQDYCNMPAALSLIQTGSLAVGGLLQMSRGMKGIPAWLQRWLDQPKPRPETVPKPMPNPGPELRAEEGIRVDGKPKLTAQEGIRGEDGEVRYVIYNGNTFVKTVIFRRKPPSSSAQPSSPALPISPEECKPWLEKILPKLEEQASSSGNLAFRPPTTIELD